MKVVIVGSEGFIGRELKKTCREKGIELVTIDTAISDHVDHFAFDVRSSEVADAIPEGADALIHLAAVSRNQTCRDNPALAFDVNVLGTLNLINAARERNVKQFIFASTDWVYGDANGDTLLTENHVIDVAKIETEYALSKLAAEQNLKLAHRRGFCPVTVLRFGIVYGPAPNNWNAPESLFAAVQTQDVVQVGSLAAARRFIHISDVAQGICSTIGRSGYEVFNLSGDTLISLQDIIDHSVEICGRCPEIQESNPNNVSIRNTDNSKARSILGWAPVISLSEGLRTLIETSDGSDLAKTISA